MDLTFFIDNYRLNLLNNFWGNPRFPSFGNFLGLRDDNGFWGSKDFCGLDYSSPTMPLCPVSNLSFSRQLFWEPTYYERRLSRSQRFVSTAFFFPLKPLKILWKQLADQTYQSLQPIQQRWRGLRVFAADGVTLKVPESLWGVFGSHRGSRGSGSTQSHAVFLYDLLARVPVNLRTGTSHQDARNLLKRMLCSLPDSLGLLLLDAGFYSFELFQRLLSKNSQFLIPMKTNATPKLLKPFSKNDGLYQISQRLLPNLPTTMTVRIVTIQRPGFLPRRLVTSLLDPQAFPAQEIAELYHHRWHIETFFREFKHTLKAQQWHAQNLHAFYTEVLFFMLLCCLTRLVMTQTGLPPASLSFSKSLRFVSRFLDLTAYQTLKNGPLIYRSLIQQITKYCKMKPNSQKHRSFVRNSQLRRLIAREKIVVQQLIKTLT